MKRRGFLGIMAGAGIAGPSAAKQAVTAASRTQLGGVARLTGMPSAAGLGGVAEDPMGSSGSWLKTAIADTRRIISGQKTDEQIERERLDDETVRHAFEIETSGMRSMSEAAKLHRMRQYARQRSEQAEIGYAKLRLKDLLRRLAREEGGV
jgi:alkylated DNA nucleotide flippase Atl1